MADLALFIPIVLFICIAAIIISIAYFRAQKARYAAMGGLEFQQLAEEATNGQRAMLDEIRRMNQVLEEIERLLKEVG